jgi:hypothetical protein
MGMILSPEVEFVEPFQHGSFVLFHTENKEQKQIGPKLLIGQSCKQVTRHPTAQSE